MSSKNQDSESVSSKQELERTLTDKQMMFAHEYVADKELNASRAYAKVYKSNKSEQTITSAASRLLKNVKVASYVRILMDERKKRLNYTADDVIRDLIEVKNRCMQADAVKSWDYENKQFIETGEYTFDSKGANQALKLLGDHLGMFNKSKLEISGDVSMGVTIIDDIPK